MAITITVKRRPKIDAQTVLKELEAEQIYHANRAVPLYEQSVHDWAQKPFFTVISISGANRIALNIYARGEVGTIYKQIDSGFSRPVEVTENFISKTQPGILHSRPGRGGVKRGPDGKPMLLESPAPVIPRNFTKLVADLIRQEYINGMKAVWKRHFGATNG